MRFKVDQKDFEGGLHDQIRFVTLAGGDVREDFLIQKLHPLAATCRKNNSTNSRKKVLSSRS